MARLRLCRAISYGDLPDQPEWLEEATLPDLREAGIAGSGFAITGYTVHEALGGDVPLVRQQLLQRGLWLRLDFVPALPVQPV